MSRYASNRINENYVYLTISGVVRDDMLEFRSICKSCGIIPSVALQNMLRFIGREKKIPFLQLYGDYIIGFPRDSTKTKYCLKAHLGKKAISEMDSVCIRYGLSPSYLLRFYILTVVRARISPIAILRGVAVPLPTISQNPTEETHDQSTSPQGQETSDQRG